MLLLEQEIVIAERFQADFNLDFYGPGTRREEVLEHVGAFLGEKLLQPRSEDLWIGRDGVLDPNYIVMMQRSIDYWKERGDLAAVERFESELTGMRNLAYLVIEHGVNNQPLPVIVMASDPGSFYVDQEGSKKSTTFVGLLNTTELEGWKYKIVALPTKFIGLERHYDLLRRIGDIEKTKQMLGASLDELTADNLVAFPVLLNQLVHSLDELALSLGYESWDKIEEIAADQLALDQDPDAKGRREMMIQDFTKRIWGVVQAGKLFNEKEAMVNAMSEMFALEAGREYWGWSGNKIQREIEKNVRLALAKKLGALSDQETFTVYAQQYDLGGWGDMVWQYGWMQSAFRHNAVAREALSTGCGGSGTNYSQGLEWDKFSLGNQEMTYAGFDVMQNFGYQSDMAVLTGNEPTGKYTDYYDYKPGVCAHCHEHKQYVAHPKSSDVKCAGWCSGCEK